MAALTLPHEAAGPGSRAALVRGVPSGRAPALAIDFNLKRVLGRDLATQHGRTSGARLEHVLVPDPTIDQHALAKLVQDEFGEPSPPALIPLGGDSWNYRAGAWWVSVRRDRQGHSVGAYEAACELREQGYQFVLAPVRGRSGRVVFHVSGKPVVVSPFTDGKTSFPAGLPQAALALLRQAVEVLHAARVAASVPRESFGLPFEAELEGASERTRSAVAGVGPFAADVAALVRRNGDLIARWREEIGELQARCRAYSLRLVLTHGEPAPPNVIVDENGRLLLLDWGDLLYAPPERDARALVEAGIDMEGQRQVKRFYELRWDLGEVAEYTAALTMPHDGDAEDIRMRRELDKYLR